MKYNNKRKKKENGTMRFLKVLNKLMQDLEDAHYE